MDVMSKQSAIVQLHTLYQSCVNCPNTEKDCPGIWKEPENGVIPDGFYFKTAPIDLLVVGKNTGHPMNNEEKNYAGLTGESLYQKQRSTRDDFFQNEKWSEQKDAFSKNLAEYLTDFLDIEEERIFSRVAITNLVKCITRDERGKLKKKTMEACFQKYLKHEVTLFRPKVILALGQEAEVFLLRKSWRILGVPIVYIRHPSYYYKRTEKAAELKRIKEEINYFINKAKE